MMWDICSVNTSKTARGRLAIWLGLVRDEHGLFRGGGEARLPGKLCQQIPDAIVFSSVKTFDATRCVSTMRVQNACALFGGFCHISVPCPIRVAKALA